MLSPQCFSLEWIKQKREELSVADPGILEKSIHALALLTHLSASKLPFTFKGGTSLLLHIPQIRRLSIDIDVVCGVLKEELDSVLKTISSIPPFIGYQEDDRGHRGLPNRRHFRFFYNKIEGGHPAPFVILYPFGGPMSPDFQSFDIFQLIGARSAIFLFGYDATLGRMSKKYS